MRDTVRTARKMKEQGNLLFSKTGQLVEKGEKI
jgi:hypothetical protein